MSDDSGDDSAKQRMSASAQWSRVRNAAGADVAKLASAALPLVVAARSTGRYREALHVGREAVDIAGASSASSASATLAMASLEAHVCLACIDAGDVTEGAHWLAKARTRHVDDIAAAALLDRAEGALLVAQQRAQDAVPVLARGIARCRSGIDDVERAHLLYHKGDALLALERAAEALPAFMDALACAHSTTDRASSSTAQSLAQWGIGAARLSTGNAPQALAAADAGLNVARTVGDPKPLARLSTLRARALTDLKRFEEAPTAARDALRDATRAGLTRERADAQLAVAETHLAMGQGRRAMLAAEEALAQANKAGMDTIRRAAERLLSDARGITTNDGG